jgi:hypothetical protein
MSGTDPALRASCANPLAYWPCIELACELGIPYDFEGSMMENVECFNRSFGARQIPYFRIYRDKRNPLVKAYCEFRSAGAALARRLGLRR